MFTGSFTALVTPLGESGSVDYSAFEKFVTWQNESGTDGFVPMGTTGESATVTEEEHLGVVAKTVEIAQKYKKPVIAGIGSNSTAHAISLGQKCQKVGADALLSVTPYYVKPSQEGMYAHFKAIHDATDLPIILYNIPGRSVVDLSHETLVKLSKLPRIKGIKDATADLARPTAIRRDCGADFCQLSGDDATVSGYLNQGGHGVISVLSNVLPRQSADLHRAWLAKDFDRFNALRDQIFTLSVLLFQEPSPAPAKACLSMMGYMEENLHLPLMPISDKLRAKLKEELLNLKVL